MSEHEACALLGQLLLASGAITPEDLNEALYRQKVSGEQLGQVLLGMGALAPRQLATLSGGVLVGVVGGVLYALSRSGVHRVLGTQFEAGSSAVVMAFCWVAFVGLVAGCAASTALAHTFRSVESRSVSG